MSVSPLRRSAYLCLHKARDLSRVLCFLGFCGYSGIRAFAFWGLWAGTHLNDIDGVQTPTAPQVRKLDIKENTPLAPYTVFKIGGPARFFCEVKNKEELAEAAGFAKVKSMPVFILGAGSNVLVSDEGFGGLVIKMNLQGFMAYGLRLTAGAGVSMARAVNFAVDRELGGFEWGVGIPGTIGGSVFGNAGCYSGEMKDVVEAVEIFDGTNFKTLENEKCKFGYRDSIFKKRPGWIIVSAALGLAPGGAKESRAKILEYSKKRALTQDIGSECAGCIFKNFNSDLPAGFLIDKAGLKGRRVGGAVVSSKHANFIVNSGEATARDIRELIELVKSEVQKKHGVLLEEEIRIV